MDNISMITRQALAEAKAAQARNSGLFNCGDNDLMKYGLAVGAAALAYFMVGQCKPKFLMSTTPAGPQLDPCKHAIAALVVGLLVLLACHYL